MKLACEKCAEKQVFGKMTLRTNKTKGNQFYGCSNFPTCTYTLSMREYERIGWSLVGDHPGDEYDW